MASKAQTGLASVISIGAVTGSTGTEVFTPIGDLTDFPLKRGAWKTVAVTNFASTSEEMLPVIKGVGTIAAKGNYNAGDAGQVKLETAYQSAAPYDFKVQFPVNAQAGQTTAGDLWAFSAYVLEYSIAQLSPEQAITFDLNIQIIGNPVVTPGT
jgi:hypothetical protein